MPLTIITTAPTAAQTTAVNGAITTIETNEPYKATLTEDEKNDFQTVAANRYPYAVKAIKDLAPNWTGKMAPDVAAMLPQATVSLTVMDTYRPIISRLKILLEYFTDGHHIAGYQAYQFLKAFYGEAQALKSRGVAGADALVDELAPLFANQGGAGGQQPVNP